MACPEQTPSDVITQRFAAATKPGVRSSGLLEWAYLASVKLTFLQFVTIIVVTAIVIAIALAVPIWGALYGVPAGQVVVVTFTVALFTATPMACFLVYVMTKAEAMRAELAGSYEILFKEREVQADTLVRLRIAHDRARAANEAKAQFLANMGHELRTPLNAIIGFSDLISSEIRGPAGNPDYVAYARSINESGIHLLALINNILDVSRIEVGDYRLNEDVVSVEKLASDAVRVIDGQAQKAGITLSCEVGENLPGLYCDVAAVNRMLFNLLTNAVSFSPPGSSVTVEARLGTNQELRLSVRDTGVGMTESEVSVALNRFSQVDTSHTRTHQGVGLGLPLTQDLIVLHGGTLEIESQPDVGTTAILTFPAERSKQR